MSQGSSYALARRRIRRTGSALACLAVMLAAACVGSYVLDSAMLRRIAVQVTENSLSESDKVLTLSKWVHDNQGFRENDSFFVFKRMRATPVQVVRRGGDCADKSRLLCALLREVGIQSTMVMCFHRHTKMPTHTVVEAETGDGQFMVVDPVYGLFFPKGDQFGFHGLLELRENPQILDRRLSDLLAVAPRTSALRSYNPESAAYDQARSINWDKNAFTRTAHLLLTSWYGDEVYRLRRPLALEEPKLFIACALGLTAACMLMAVRVGRFFFVRPISTCTLAGAASCGR